MCMLLFAFAFPGLAGWGSLSFLHWTALRSVCRPRYTGLPNSWSYWQNTKILTRWYILCENELSEVEESAVEFVSGVPVLLNGIPMIMTSRYFDVSFRHGQYGSEVGSDPDSLCGKDWPTFMVLGFCRRPTGGPRRWTSLIFDGHNSSPEAVSHRRTYQQCLSKAGNHTGILEGSFLVRWRSRLNSIRGKILSVMIRRWMNNSFRRVSGLLFWRTSQCWQSFRECFVFPDCIYRKH